MMSKTAVVACSRPARARVGFDIDRSALAVPLLWTAAPVPDADDGNYSDARCYPVRLRPPPATQHRARTTHGPPGSARQGGGLVRTMRTTRLTHHMTTLTAPRYGYTSLASGQNYSASGLPSATLPPSLPSCAAAATTRPFTTRDYDADLAHLSANGAALWTGHDTTSLHDDITTTPNPSHPLRH